MVISVNHLLQNSDAAQIAPLPGVARPSGDLTTSHSRWAAVLAGMQGREPDGYEFRFSLLRLKSWPCLTHVPEPTIPVVARICALLARRPTTASLLPLSLGLSKEQVFPIIEALRLNQHLQIVGGGPTLSTEKPSQNQQEISGEDVGSLGKSSLIGKIWQRLGIGA